MPAFAFEGMPLGLDEVLAAHALESIQTAFRAIRLADGLSGLHRGQQLRLLEPERPLLLDDRGRVIEVLYAEQVARHRAIYIRDPTAADVTEHTIETFAFGMQPEQAQAKAPKHRFGRGPSTQHPDRNIATRRGLVVPRQLRIADLHLVHVPGVLGQREDLTIVELRDDHRRSMLDQLSTPHLTPSGACDASTRRRTAVPTGGRDPRGPPRRAAGRWVEDDCVQPEDIAHD